MLRPYQTHFQNQSSEFLGHCTPLGFELRCDLAPVSPRHTVENPSAAVCGEVVQQRFTALGATIWSHKHREYTFPEGKPSFRWGSFWDIPCKQSLLVCKQVFEGLSLESSAAHSAGNVGKRPATHTHRSTPKPVPSGSGVGVSGGRV